MSTVHRIVVTVVFFIALVSPCTAFVTPNTRNILLSIQQRQSPPDALSTIILKSVDDNDDMVEVGSKEYLDGFISSPIQDESVAERGSGLEQALKLGGFFAIGLGVLFLGFMASNGLL